MKWTTLAVAALLAGAPAGAQPTMPPGLPGYAVLGVEAVSIRHDTRVASGAVGAIGGTVTLGGGVRVAGVVAAPIVRTGRGTRVGRLFCDLVSGPPVLPSCRAFTSPLLDPAVLSPVVATSGTDDLRIPRRTGTAPIAAASYRDISVGRGGLLQLAGGSYSARSVTIGRAGRLVCVAACRPAVVGDVLLRRGAEIGADSPQRAGTARIDVAGSGAVPGFTTRFRTRVSATIYAPDAAIILGPSGTYRGAFVGRSVTIGVGATVRADSAL